MNRSIIAAFLLTAAVPAFAQTAKPAAPALAPAPPAAAVTRVNIIAQLDGDFAALDFNKDGKATKAEIEKRIAEAIVVEVALMTRRRDESFKKLDTNSDGQISRAEFDLGVPLRKVRAAEAAPTLDRFDANKDGSITATEYRAPTLVKFDQLDANKDGKLTAAEQQAAPPGR